MDKRTFTYTNDEVRSIVLDLYPRIICYIRHKVGSRWEHCAEDIFHDVLYRFLTSRRKIESSKVAEYLFASVRNACVNFLTRKSVQNQSLHFSSRDQEIWETIYESEFSVTDEDDSESEKTVGISEIMAFAELLPEKTREVFIKSRIEGRKLKEIADEMDITVRAVQKHITVSIRKFRKKFPDIEI